MLPKVASLHFLWACHLDENPDLPCFYFCRYHLRRAFAERTLEQIPLLPSLSQSAMDLLPLFYYFIMSSWFRLSRVLEDDAIVIPGSGSSVCPLSTLSARFVYREFSKIAVSRSGQTATSLSPSKILRTIILIFRDNYPQSSFFYPLNFTPLYLRQTRIPHLGIILQG